MNSLGRAKSSNHERKEGERGPCTIGQALCVYRFYDKPAKHGTRSPIDVYLSLSDISSRFPNPEFHFLKAICTAVWFCSGGSAAVTIAELSTAPRILGEITLITLLALDRMLFVKTVIFRRERSGFIRFLNAVKARREATQPLHTVQYYEILHGPPLSLPLPFLIQHYESR